jgi:hypothetical protein
MSIKVLIAEEDLLLLYETKRTPESVSNDRSKPDANGTHDQAAHKPVAVAAGNNPHPAASAVRHIHLASEVRRIHPASEVVRRILAVGSGSTVGRAVRVDFAC